MCVCKTIYTSQYLSLTRTHTVTVTVTVTCKIEVQQGSLCPFSVLSAPLRSATQPYTIYFKQCEIGRELGKYRKRSFFQVLKKQNKHQECGH